MRILITGATGFIGSNIAKKLLENNCNVFATYRTISSFEKCIQFKDKINWINIDNCEWKEQIRDIKPDQLIHGAWSGIDAESRNKWGMQIRNFWLSKEYFELAKECGIRKIISFGSQAEYGVYDFPVNEETLLKPVDAYGAAKTLTANYLRNLFENTIAEWYWVRIFSVFGEGENNGWLIPSVISKLLKNEPIQLTLCEQKYNYLYIEDLVTQILSIVKYNENASGIYNICHSESIVLRELLIQIVKLLGVSQDLLQFGAIPYRSGQNMIIAGDNSKFSEWFYINSETQIGLTKGLIKTIEYYRGRVL